MAPFVIGTMAPDLEYLLRLEPYALISHSLAGLLRFCLPAGLALYLLWSTLLRPVGRALVALPAPQPIRSRSLTDWAIVVAALCAGSATHVAWDALTHRDTVGPVLFPVLRTTAFSIGGVAVPWYNVLQVVSSLLGGIVVLAWLWKQLPAGGRRLGALLAPWRLRLWIVLAVASISVGAWNAPRRGLMSGVAEEKLVLGRFAVGALVGLLLGLVALAILHRRGRFSLEEWTADPSRGAHG